jgi:hypothetical protein
MNMHEAIMKFEESGSKWQNYFTAAPENGMWMEFGVSSGSTFRIIAEGTTKKVYGFDCWEGLPEEWLNSEGNPRHAKGDFKSDRPTNLPENCILIDGLFEDSIPTFIETHKEPIALIHIDCDLYSSTKTIFDNFKDQFQSGTIIIFDELIDYDGWELHEYKAFNEFLDETGYKWECLGRHGPHRVGMRIYK